MIVLGRIGAPYGVQGWVRLHPFGDDPLSWKSMLDWWVSADPDAPDADWQTRRLKGCRVHGDGLVVKFDGVDDRSAAELQLKGLFVGAPREAMPEPEEDEYYWGDLVGLSVETLAGEPLGVVRELMATGANDVLCVCASDGTERLLPFVAAVIHEVDVPGGRIRADWGLDW